MRAGHLHALLRPGSLAGNAAFTALAFALSRVLGLLREMLIAWHFGTGEAFDAYVAAFRIPDLIFTVVMSGAFGAAFIPVFTGFLAEGDERRAVRLVNALLTWAMVALSVVALVMLVFAGPLVTRVVAPELSPRAAEIAIDLTRLFLLSPLLLGLGAAAKGMLEARSIFTLPAVAPLLYNLGIIAGAVVLAPVWGIYGLAAGVIAGAAAHAGVQFAGLARRGYRFRPLFARDVTGLARVGLMMRGRIGTQLTSQANIIVTTNIASRLGEGAISSVYFAQNLVMLPHGIIAMSLATVIFPRLSRQHAEGEHAAFRRTLLAALGPLAFLSLPGLVLLLAFRESIVHVLFQYGSFDTRSAGLVAAVLGAYALSLVSRSIVEPLTRGFYAMNDTRTPMWIMMITTGLHILTGWPLADAFGPAGLVLSLSANSLARMVIMLAVLSRRIEGGLVRPFLGQVRPMLPALALSAVAAWLFAGPVTRLTDPADGRTLAGYLAFGAACVAVVATYLIVSRVAGVPELRQLERRVLGRLRP